MKDRMFQQCFEWDCRSHCVYTITLAESAHRPISSQLVGERSEVGHQQERAWGDQGFQRLFSLRTYYAAKKSTPCLTRNMSAKQFATDEE